MPAYPAPKHAKRSHSHPYRAVYDNLGQSRAVCAEGLTHVCDATYCPRHAATAYTDHMARHATDSLIGSAFKSVFA